MSTIAAGDQFRQNDFDTCETIWKSLEANNLDFSDRDDKKVLRSELTKSFQDEAMDEDLEINGSQ